MQNSKLRTMFQKCKVSYDNQECLKQLVILTTDNLKEFNGNVPSAPRKGYKFEKHGLTFLFSHGINFIIKEFKVVLKCCKKHSTIFQ